MSKLAITAASASLALSLFAQPASALPAANLSAAAADLSTVETVACGPYRCYGGYYPAYYGGYVPLVVVPTPYYYAYPQYAPVYAPRVYYGGYNPYRRFYRRWYW